MKLILPFGADAYAACVFGQDGRFVTVGHREECEQIAMATGGLYCWIYSGRVIVRADFVQGEVDEAVVY